jgi:hypothetical protein
MKERRNRVYDKRNILLVKNVNNRNTYISFLPQYVQGTYFILIKAYVHVFTEPC